MIRKEDTVNLLNGMYKMLTAGDCELLGEAIDNVPDKLGNRMVRALLSYGYLTPEVTLGIMTKCFGLYREYFGKVFQDEDFEKMMKNADEIKQSFENAEQQEYAVKVLLAFIDEIDDKAMMDNKAMSSIAS